MKLLLLFSILALSGKSPELPSTNWMKLLPPMTNCDSRVNEHVWQRCPWRI